MNKVKEEHNSLELEKIDQNISDYKFALDESCIVTITDKKGIIQYVNDNFCYVSKFTKEELNKFNISEDMPTVNQIWVRNQ